MEQPSPPSEKPVPLIGRPVFFGWWIVLATFFLGLLGGGALGFGISAFFLSLEEEFSAGRRGVLSLILALAPVQGAMLGPIQGHLVDRFGPKMVMRFGVTLMGLGWVLASTAPSMGLFAVYFLMIGAGNGMGLVAPPLATVGRWFVKKRGIAYGIAGAGFSLGAVLVPGVNFLIENLEWRKAALVIGCVIWSVGLPLTFLMRRRPEDHGLLPDGAQHPANAERPVAPDYDEADFSVGEALTSRAFWLLNTNFALRSLVISAIGVHFVPAMVDKEFSRQTAAALFAFFGVMSLPGRLGVGFLMDRLEKRTVAAVVAFMVAVSMLLLVWAGALWQMFLFLIVYSVAIGGGGSAMFTIRAEYFGRKSLATISGFGSLFMSGGSLCGSTLAGFVFQKTGTYDSALYAFAGLSLVALAAIAVASRPVPKRLRGKAAAVG